MNVTDYIKTYWPIFVTLLTISVTMIVKDTSNEARITALELRADRQGTTIMLLQGQVTGLANDVSSMKATVDAINNNVNYIRNRIDRVTQ